MNDSTRSGSAESTNTPRGTSHDSPSLSAGAVGQAQVTPRVAAIGVGYWGQNVARNLGELGALAAVVDRDEQAALAVARGFDASVDEFASVLADDSIDAVAVAAPAELHYELARSALDSGKHVFVEKPLALDLDHAEELTLLAEERGLVLMVGHLLRYHPAYVELQRLVGDGRLGRLQYIYSNRLNFGKIRVEEDILWSFAPHDISMILGLVGEEPSNVHAVGAKYLHDRVADVTTTHLEFSNGIRAHVFVSWLHPFKEQKLVVVGDRAMATFDDSQPWDSKLSVYDQAVDWRDQRPVANRAEPKHCPVPEGEPLRAEMTHFLECITTGSRPLTDGIEATAVLRVLATASKKLDAPSAATAPADGVDSIAGADYFVHPTSEIDAGVSIGDGTRIWHYSHVLGGSSIGRDCSFGQSTMVGPNVTVGDNCRIQNNVSLFEGVTLDDDVFCGPSCVFTNVTNPRAFYDQKDRFAATHVGRGASIGANATVVCGHDIGPYALIAAGAVVTSDVPPHALMVGVPARQRGWVSHRGHILDEDLVCPEAGTRYELVNGRLQPSGGQEFDG